MYIFKSDIDIYITQQIMGRYENKEGSKYLIPRSRNVNRSNAQSLLCRYTRKIYSFNEF